jgi:hypothetical protein
MATSAKALAARCCEAKADDSSRIQSAFERAYGRPPTDEDVRLGLEFLGQSDDASDEQSKLTRWEQYAQALLSTNEFMFVD